jgi:hypothetical protein
MAGRLGFVMGQLEEARQTIRLLQAPASEPAPDDVVVEQAPAETASTTTPAPSAPDSGVQGPLRPWWRALWPWGRQPA